MATALDMLFHPERYENAEEFTSLLCEYRTTFGDIPEYVSFIYSADELIVPLRIMLSRRAAFPAHGPDRRWIEREMPACEVSDPNICTLQ